MIKRLLIVAVALCAMILVAYGGSADPFQCVSGNNVWKNDSGGAYTAPSDYIISAIWVKAGQNCYELPHACYTIASGGIGYDYVEVVDAGGCQELSHLEGLLSLIPPSEPTVTKIVPTTTAEPTATVASPTPTLTEVTTQISPTPSNEVTNTPTSVIVENTPTSTTTPLPEPSSTPYPTKECQIDHCNGLG